MLRTIYWIIALAPLLLGCESVSRADSSSHHDASRHAIAMAQGGNMQLTSSSFSAGGSIPVRHTCMGADISPPLSWMDPPEGTRSFALIVDDPDAPDPKHPKMVWVHWVLYNIPSNTLSLPEGVAALPSGTLEGLNDWKQTGFRGPCPPIGRHRYFFKLYALNARLPDLKTPTKANLLKAMTPHILAQAEFMGIFSKQ